MIHTSDRHAYTRYDRTGRGEKWTEASHDPCPICQRHGWCRVSPDGSVIACRRVEVGAYRVLEYGDGGQAYLHKADGSAPRPSVVLDTRPSVERAADADLDRVYRAILARLTLSRTHADQLQARGLTQADISREGYRSMPLRGRSALCRNLREIFADHLLLTVPGIVTLQGDNGDYLSLTGRPGLLIPVRDAGGLVVGLLVRPDDPGSGGGKYCWLSSRSAGGAGPGARTHVPLGATTARPGAPGRWVVVEGGLKADVAFALSGRPVVAMPGCVVTAETVRVLQGLGCRQPLLAMDADVAVNPSVAAAQRDGLARLRGVWGDQAGILEWPAEMGKGLDDALLASRSRGGDL